MSSNELSLQYVLNNQFVSTKDYYLGLNAALNDLAPFLSFSERKDLCFNKLGLKDNNVAEQPFIQAAVELTVCAHFARLFPKGFVYEEKVNPPKDVDCSFCFASVITNLTLKLSVPTLKRNMPSMMAKVSKLVCMVD